MRRYHTILFAVFVAGGLLSLLGTSTTCLAEGVGVRAAIEADWLRQEQRRGTDPADPAALERVVRRGRCLADDLEGRGAAEAARRARSTLDAVEQRARDILKDWRRPDAAGTKDYHLVGAAVGGGGADFDSDRVKGKDWAYSPDDSAKLGGLRTLSWDDQEVLYRFRNLGGDAPRRLRLLFASNTRRAQAVAVNGRELDRFVLEAWRVTERWLDVPREANVGGGLEVAIRTTGSNNVIVSGIEVWGPHPPADPALAARLEARRKVLASAENGYVPALRPLYLEARRAVRELAFANPLLDFSEVAFVRRPWPAIGHQCAHRVGASQQPGASLCILKGLQPDAEVLDLTGPRLAPGGIGRFDLSFDARRIVFPYAAPRTPPMTYGLGEQADPRTRGGPCEMYDIYEIGVDGNGLKQLTRLSDAEDTEPCYLPDGRICFTSSRAGKLVQCGDWALACGLYTMNPDGSGVNCITQPKEGEFYPSMLEDGRIIYTRWDYLMKPFNMIQQLWTVAPDGAGAQLVYGDHYDFSKGPIAFFEPRQVPGTSWIVCTGGAHHNTCAGPLVLVDLKQHRGGPEGMRNLTPEVGYPELTADSLHGWYASPWPLSESYFLVSFSPEGANNVRNGYGLYLFDRFGNLELIYRDKDQSVYSPIPLKARQAPVVLANQLEPAASDTPATMMVANVYQGLEGVPPGTVKYLRILESHNKTVHSKPMTLDVGIESGTDPRGVLGTVPVEDDGSAHFTVPPQRHIFFEALDQDHLEIRRMRNYLTAQAGEKVSCVGCHEKPEAAYLNPSTPKAFLRKPSTPTPPAWGTGAIDFREVVQPVLDRHCIGCHDGSTGNNKSVDLRGLNWASYEGAFHYDFEPWRVFSSYRTLLDQVSYVHVRDYAGPVTPLPANATGSSQSKLMRLLKKGHHEVRLPEADWQALASWIDCNAPFYGGWDEIEYVPRGVDQPTAQQLDRRRDELRKTRPAAGLVCYVDLGPCVSDGPWRSPHLRLPSDEQGGDSVQLFKGEQPAEPWHATAIVNRRPIHIRASNLDPAKRYTLGLSLWDFDGQGRVQSVRAVSSDASRTFPLIEPSPLPGWKNRNEKPAERSASIPPAAYADGRASFIISETGGKDATLGEVWLFEEPTP